MLLNQLSLVRPAYEYVKFFQFYLTNVNKPDFTVYFNFSFSQKISVLSNGKNIVCFFKARSASPLTWFPVKMDSLSI